MKGFQADMVRIIARTSIGVMALVLIGMVFLSACGSDSNAPMSNASSNTNSATGNGTTGNGNRPNPPVSGTIQQYDAAKQALTVKETNGSTQTFTIQKNRILKDQKITQQELGKLLSGSGVVVRVIGPVGSDGTYTAQTLVVTSVPAGNSAQNAPGINRTPPPNGGANGNNRANRGVSLRNSKLQNNQLIGMDRNGKSITVNLSGNTTMIEQSAATVSDLKSGQTVSVTSLRARNGSTAVSAIVTIGDFQLVSQPNA
jgi:hypothetical protein